MAAIVFFVSTMHAGGAERVAALLANRWATLGHGVTLVATYSKRGRCHYPLDARVNLVFLSDLVGSQRKTPWTALRRLIHMRAIVRRSRARAVLSFLAHVNVAALVATRGLGVPVTVSERAYPPAMPLSPVLRGLRRITYPWAAKVVMQTRSGLQWLQREIPKGRGVVIANPCAFPLPQGEPRVEPRALVPAGRRLLLAVGRLSAQKGFDLLIDAFLRLHGAFTDWDLVILGEGPERHALEERIAAHTLADRVLLPGRAGNVGDWYRRADLYVMSSRFEGFPNTLLEAMAHGLPAVSFDCRTGPAELIVAGTDGLLVPQTSGSGGLAGALGRLMANGDLRTALGSRATAVRERYGFERVCTRWDRALNLDAGREWRRS